MKYQKSVIYLFLIFLYGCCKSHYKGEINFSTEELIVNPYNGHEILTFVGNNNDTVIFHGQSRELTTQKRSDGDCADCCVDFYNVETDQTIFTSPFLLSEFAIYLNFTGQFPPAVNKNPEISFIWFYKDSLEKYIITEFKKFPIDSMKAFAIHNELYKDSVFLRTKEFNNVYISVGKCYYANSLHVDTLFYSESEGIIGLRFSDGNLLVKE